MLEGTLTTENEDFSDAAIDFTLEVNGIDTNQTDRDNHLKSGDFFNSEEFLKISFKSTSFQKSGDDYKLEGHLTIKDVTKPVTLDVDFGETATDFYGNVKAGFEVTGKINPKEFGLTWNRITKAGAIVVGQDIKLDINVQFAKQA